MANIRDVKYMSFWDLLAAFLLVLTTLLFFGIAVGSAVMGLVWIYVVICAAAGVLTGYAVCIMVWCSIGMGKLYGTGIGVRAKGNVRVADITEFEKEFRNK